MLIIRNQAQLFLGFPCLFAYDDKRIGSPRSKIGFNHASDIFLGLNGAEEKEIVFVIKAKSTLHIAFDIADRLVAVACWDVHGLIGIRDTSFRNTEQIDDVLFGRLTHGHNVIGASGQAPHQAEVMSLIIQRGVGQAQRYKIMQRVDVFGIGDAERERIGPMHDIRRLAKMHIHASPKPFAVEFLLLIKTLNVPDMVEIGQARAESIPDDPPRDRHLCRDFAKGEREGAPQIHQVFRKP